MSPEPLNMEGREDNAEGFEEAGVTSRSGHEQSWEYAVSIRSADALCQLKSQAYITD